MRRCTFNEQVFSTGLKWGVPPGGGYGGQGGLLSIQVILRFAFLEGSPSVYLCILYHFTLRFFVSLPHKIMF